MNTLIYATQYQPSGGLAYGGGEFHTRNGVIVFVNKDGCIFKHSINNQTSQLSRTEGGSVSSPTISPDGKFVIYLHSDGKDDSIRLIKFDQTG